MKRRSTTNAVNMRYPAAHSRSESTASGHDPVLANVKPVHRPFGQFERYYRAMRLRGSKFAKATVRTLAGQ